MNKSNKKNTIPGQKSDVKTYFDYFLVIFSIFLGIFLNKGTLQIAFFAFVIWQILYPLPSRILAKILIFFLFLTPIVFVIGQDNRADELAVAAYYFMVFTLIMLIIETRNKKRLKE